jgi:hypothetical protein
MLINIVTFTVLIGISFWLAEVLAARHNRKFLPVFRHLIWYHAVLAFVYYLYAIFNPSDSWEYYNRVIRNFRGELWFDFYGVSTPFIEFLGYPFIKYLQLPYESLMMIFAWFGLLGFFFFYIFIKERIFFKHTLFGIDIILIVIFLPNLHFWSASFGKGSIIFLGLGLFFYGLSQVNKRIIALVIGGLIVYHVRPHILFILLAGTVMGFTFSTKGVNWGMRVAVILLAILAFNYIYADVMSLIGFEEEELLSEGSNLTRRVRGLTRATSGVDITQYNFSMKLFTFLFRPLFFDAPGILGIIVSFENLFYIIIFLKIIRPSFISFFRKSDYLVKTVFISFFGVASALAQISANLGLAMRQKSQVMILLLFVILKFMDEQKMEKLRSVMIRRKMHLKTPVEPERI